jgi:acyl-CoA synthetase (AMP-forming)/AMP-acid ligase II
MLTHKNIMTNLNAIGEGGGYTDKDTSFSWMPLTHDMGLIGFHLNMVAYRMNQCLMATDLFSRRPLLWMQKVSEKKATVLCSPNFGYKHFLKALSKKPLEDVDLSCVRLIYNGAEPISIDLCDTFLTTMEPYGLKRETMFTVYGMAEATLAVSFPVQGEHYRAVHVDRHNLNVGEKVKFIYEANQDALSFAIVGKPVLLQTRKMCLLKTRSVVFKSAGRMSRKGIIKMKKPITPRSRKIAGWIQAILVLFMTVS